MAFSKEKKMPPKVIAFYLPQYHPTPDNDIWWGKGYTEWTNVGKAKPLFKGHYQPKVPADLGYYDLRLPEIRKQQAELAREAGIAGFCYYHYWFGNGKQELEMPFNEVLHSGEPDFPFCLCWANESWHAKFWNNDGSSNKKLLIEQQYLGKDDNEKHFYSVLEAFRDKRYMTYKGKPIFMIYRPLNFPHVEDLIKLWNELALKNGLQGIHFVGQAKFPDEIEKFKSMGFDAVNMCRLNNYSVSTRIKYRDLFVNAVHKFLHYPYIYDYKKVLKRLIGDEEKIAYVYPTALPNWDHTPRSGKNGYLFHNATPALFEKHLREIISKIEMKEPDDQIIFLKSWNEWGEGNYVEPDLKFGMGFLEALKKVLL
jgi:hypothetical protein